MFWDKQSETLSRSSLEAQQLSCLRDTVARVSEKVPFYSSKLADLKVSAESIRSLADVAKLPFTTGIDLRTIYPTGLLAVDASEPVRLHTSSGTTGKPKALFFSRNDVNNAAELIARSLVMTGITKADVFQNMMSYGLFTGGACHALRSGKGGLPCDPPGPFISVRPYEL